jgi:transposase
VEGIILRSKDQIKLEVMYKITKGSLSRRDGQCLLKVSERTLRRYLKAYDERGVDFLRHKNYRRRPVNKTPEDLKRKVLDLIRERYFDFNVSHLQEKLFEELGQKIKYETLRKWCHEIHLVKRGRKRRTRVRKYRERMSQEGLMLQMDGSHHEWFGGRFLCLMAAIDDATGEVFARFYEGETVWACMDFLPRVIHAKGVFKVLYTDKAGVYGGVKREYFSQVERAIGELGAQVIYAHSPEAKGRVERLFQTLQDRLVAELRFADIKTIEKANEYLEQVYLPAHNGRYKLLPHNPVSAYMALPRDMNLDLVFCIKEYRVVARDHTVSVSGERWMIADELKQSIYRQRIELRFDKWGRWTAYFAGRKINLVKIKKDYKLAG